MKLLKEEFPILSTSLNFTYLDSAGTTLKPKKVIKASSKYYEYFSINLNTSSRHKNFTKTRTIIEECKKLIAKRINGLTNCIYFLPSSTYAFNILALSLKKYLNKSEIILTKLEHSSNIFPWQKVSLENKMKINYLELEDNFEINTEESKIKEKINEKTKLVSFSHIFNSLGAKNNIKKISKYIKEKSPNCLIVVDVSQSISYAKINVEDWNIDCLIFSGHKAFGPTGIGIMWISKKMEEKLEKIIWGGGDKKGPLEFNHFPFESEKKLETGTLPLSQIFGLKASFEFMKKHNQNQWEKKIRGLANYTFNKLEKIKEIEIYNKKNKKKKYLNNSIILFNLKKMHPHDVSDYLNKKNVITRPGNFCCPYLQDTLKIKSAIRVSFSVYNEKKDIDTLVKNLQNLISLWKKKKYSDILF